MSELFEFAKSGQFGIGTLGSRKATRGSATTGADLKCRVLMRWCEEQGLGWVVSEIAKCHGLCLLSPCHMIRFGVSLHEEIQHIESADLFAAEDSDQPVMVAPPHLP